MSAAYIGISGYLYRHWRGAFYPEGLAQRRWLAHAAAHFSSIELNGTFYSLKWPSVFERWMSEVSRADFIFAIKGSRFITHRLRLRDCRQAMANFFASGVLALAHRTGPFLWQLPPNDRFDPDRLGEFLRTLPRDSEQAGWLAKQHDTRLKRGALVEPEASMPLRHAFEVRHPSYDTPRFFELLREHDCAFVLADSAGRFLFAEQITTDFVYLRLHGSQELYVSRYTEQELDWWAERIQGWRAEGKAVYAYFDNDALGHAPYDALRLSSRVLGAETHATHPGAGFRGRL